LRGRKKGGEVGKQFEPEFFSSLGRGFAFVRDIEGGGEKKDFGASPIYTGEGREEGVRELLANCREKRHLEEEIANQSSLRKGEE